MSDVVPCPDCPFVQALATARGMTVPQLLALFVDQTAATR